MKKFITSFAIAASMLCGTASAQAPQTFNYQGVCGWKDKDVKVEFRLYKTSDTEKKETVYAEEQSATTNSEGRFTAQIGGGEPVFGTWDELDWANEAYTLIATVNGETAAECALQSVPYANVASKYVGQEENEKFIAEVTNELYERTAPVEGLQASVDVIEEWMVENATLPTTVKTLQGIVAEQANILENAYKGAEQAMAILAGDPNDDDPTGLVDDVKALQQTTDDLQYVHGALKMKADVSDLNEKYDELKAKDDELSENILNVTRQTLEVGTTTNAQLNSINKKIDEINEKAFSNEEGALSLANGLSKAEDAIMELTRDNMQNKAAITELQDNVEANTVNIQSLSLFQETFQDEVMSPIQEVLDTKVNIADYEEEVTGIYENMKNLAKFQETFDEEYMSVIDANIKTVADGLSVVEDDLRDVVKNGLPMIKSDLGDTQAQVTLNTEAINGVSEKVEKEHNRIEVLEAKANLTADALTAVDDALKAADKKAEALQGQVDGLGETLQEILGEDSPIAAAIQDVDKKVDAVEGKVEGLSDTMAELIGDGTNEGQIALQIKAAQDAVQAQVDGAFEAIQALTGEDGWLNTQFGELGEDVKALQNEDEKINGKIEGLSDTLTELIGEDGTLTKQLLDSQKEVEKMQLTIGKQQEKINKLIYEVGVLDATLKALKGE